MDFLPLEKQINFLLQELHRRQHRSKVLFFPASSTASAALSLAVASAAFSLAAASAALSLSALVGVKETFLGHPKKS